MRSDRADALRSDALSTKEVPRGPRAQQQLNRQPPSSARPVDMHPPAGPSSTRDAVDIRSSSSTKPDRSPPSRTQAGRDRATSPSRSSRRRSRSPPAKTSRSGSVDSSHSTRSGSRRAVDKESEKDREDRKLADRESTLSKSRMGDDRESRDRGDRNGDRDRDRDRDSRDPRRASGARTDRDPRDPRDARGSDRRNEPYGTSSTRRREVVGGRDTPPHSRARSPHRDERDTKRLKTDKEVGLRLHHAFFFEKKLTFSGLGSIFSFPRHPPARDVAQLHHLGSIEMSTRIGRVEILETLRRRSRRFRGRSRSRIEASTRILEIETAGVEGSVNRQELPM